MKPLLFGCFLPPRAKLDLGVPWGYSQKWAITPGKVRCIVLCRSHMIWYIRDIFRTSSRFILPITPSSRYDRPHFTEEETERIRKGTNIPRTTQCVSARTGIRSQANLCTQLLHSANPRATSHPAKARGPTGPGTPVEAQMTGTARPPALALSYIWTLPITTSGSVTWGQTRCGRPRMPTGFGRADGWGGTGWPWEPITASALFGAKSGHFLLHIQANFFSASLLLTLIRSDQ